jgi:uncharacterized protein (TIGR03067 family)
MRARLFVASAALLVLTAFAPAPFEKKDDLKKMAGAWSVVRYEQAGAAVQVAPNTTVKTKIEGNKWNFLRVSPAGTVPSTSYTFTLDPKKNPRWLDMTRTTGEGKLLGIYRFDGENLQIAFHTFGVNERPTEFGGADKRVYYLTLQKDKP